MNLSECDEFLKLAYEFDSVTASEALSRIRAESKLTAKDLNILWRVCCGGDVELTIDIMRLANIRDIQDHVNLRVSFNPGEY